MVVFVFGIVAVYLSSEVLCFNASDVKSWLPNIESKKTNGVENLVQPLPYTQSKNARSARLSHTTSPEQWKSYLTRPYEYYETTGDGDENDRRIIAQPDKKYGHETLTFTTHGQDQSDYQKSCHETRSGGEDGLTQIANAVSKIAKMLFGAFIIILLVLVLAKMFFLPLKLFFIMKILLKLALIWPILSRVFPMLGSNSVVVGKLASPSTVEATRDLMEYFQQELTDTNSTRTSKSFDFNNEANTTFLARSRGKLYCDRKMLCFLSKAILLKNNVSNIVTSAAFLLSGDITGIHTFIRYLEKKNEFQECVKIKCNGFMADDN